MSEDGEWLCHHCNETNRIELHVGTVGLTPDQLDEMDPEDIENWQEANAPVQCCVGCGTQKGS